jgi:hypothetical protein
MPVAEQLPDALVLGAGGMLAYGPLMQIANAWTDQLAPLSTASNAVTDQTVFDVGWLALIATLAVGDVMTAPPPTTTFDVELQDAVTVFGLMLLLAEVVPGIRS